MSPVAEACYRLCHSVCVCTVSIHEYNRSKLNLFHITLPYADMRHDFTSLPPELEASVDPFVSGLIYPYELAFYIARHEMVNATKLRDVRFSLKQMTERLMP